MVQAQGGGVLAFVPYGVKHSISLADGVRRVSTRASPSPPVSSSLPQSPAHLLTGGKGKKRASSLSASAASAASVSANGSVSAPTSPVRGFQLNGNAKVNSKLGVKLNGKASKTKANGVNGRVNGVHGNASLMPSMFPSEDADDEESTAAGSAAPSSVTGRASAASTPAATPSRKGKERAEESESEESEDRRTPTPGSTPKAGKVSGKANGKVKANGNGKATPKTNGTANGAVAANGTPNGVNGHAGPSKEDARSLAPAVIDLSWPDQVSSMRRAAGLHNGSMACYTNATLQVIMHTPPVLRIALQHQSNKCMFATKHKFCMLCAIRDITADHWSGKKRAYRPQQVHGHLGQIRKGFSRNRQEDTHEFFRFVTDAFQNTALQGLPKELPEKTKRTSWVYRAWGGQVRSRVLCLSCKKPSDTFDSFLDLSLDVPNRARSLKDLFEVFCHEDRLDGDNKYNCENCKKKSAATKAMRITEAPPVLTLHLKRFGYSLTWPSKVTKVNNAITYPQVLDIAPFMTEGEHAGTQYRLFAVTCHHGSSLHYGHYTSYVRGPDGAWFNADDDDVSPVNIKTVLDDRAAYLLSYMRVGKGEKAPSAPPTPAARTESAPSSPAVKRRRDDSPPAPAAKRASVGGAVASARRPLVAVYGTTSDRRAKPSPLALDKYASGEEEGSDSDGLDAKVNKLARPRATPPADVNVLHPRPRALQLAPNAVSPIARPKNPSPAASASASTSAAGSAPGSPCSPRKLKGKFHRANPKHGVDARSHPHSHSHSHSHKGHHKRKPNALNPFAAGHAKPRSNARFNLAGREVSLPRKKGIIRNMRPRGL